MADLEVFYEEVSNPLDGMDDVLQTPDLSFNRTNRDELFVTAKGRYGNYRMMFMWDELMGALQFCCEYGLTVADSNRALAAETVLNINSNLWLGHFDLHSETLSPTFRYTQLFRGLHVTGTDHVQELIRIALDECDRNYPVFIALSRSDTPDDEDMALAMMPAVGSA